MSIPTPARTEPSTPLSSTDSGGLDHILRGGPPSSRLYLVQGDPGVGKTTLALQFLIEGVIGPTGVGKSTVALRYSIAAAERGERTAFYAFDENLHALLERSGGLGMNLREHTDAGCITLQQVNPAEMTPGQFATAVRSAAQSGCSLIIIDGLNGYLNAMPDDQFLALHLHDLLKTLGSLGATTLVTVAQHGMMGSGMTQPVDATYLADTVMLFRYDEHAGEIRQTLSVAKRRGGVHERTIRELRIGPPMRTDIGAPHREFRGVGTGTPVYHGDGKRE